MVSLVFLLGLGIHSAGDDPADAVVFAITLDRGADHGQNFGTLFEVRSAAGQPLLGAGFLGSYNTFDRAGRHALHVFEWNEAPATFKVLPRVNDDAGTYLFERGGRLYARSAGGHEDSKVRVLDESANRWDVVTGVEPEATPVADGLLEVGERAVRFKGRVVLDWPEGQGTLARPYYGQGRLILWNHFEPEDPRTERLLTWPWAPDQTERLDPGAALVLPLSKKGEFPYAMGQLRSDVLVTTNLGGVHRLRAGRWDALRAPDGKSHQDYAALNVGDVLWMGHYPSGEVLEYDGESLKPKPGYPPVMAGVSRSAREAQTLTLYGGELYAGVWPWAELWALRPGIERWGLAQRMFRLPAATGATVHPYEKETQARGAVLNQWGQRITSLVPMGTNLYLSTSAKNSKPWSPEFDFLDEAARAEYGLVHRISRPGALAAPLRWTAGPTRLRVVIGPETIQVFQDDAIVGEARRPRPNERPSDDILRAARWVQGQGLYGPARVKSLRVEAKNCLAAEQPAAPPPGPR